MAIDEGVRSPAKGRLAITAASQTIDLVTRRRHVQAWLDTGASDVHISLANQATTVTADDNFPKIDATIAYARDVAFPGTRYIHFIGTGTTGKLNYEAW